MAPRRRRNYLTLCLASCIERGLLKCYLFREAKRVREDRVLRLMGQNNRRAELKISLRVVDDDDDAPSSLSLFLSFSVSKFISC